MLRERERERERAYDVFRSKRVCIVFDLTLKIVVKFYLIKSRHIGRRRQLYIQTLRENCSCVENNLQHKETPLERSAELTCPPTNQTL
jgi:hypothetical protein